MFVQLVIAGHLLLFSTRASGFFFQPPFPEWKFFTAIMGTQVLAACMAAFGWLVTPHLLGPHRLHMALQSCLAFRDRPLEDRDIPPIR
jgi:hypothetical protein